VSAVDTSGNEGSQSDSTSGTPTATGGDSEPPSKVTGLSVTDAKDGKLNLVWNAATDNIVVDHYKIYRNNVFLLNRTSTSYQDTGLANGQSYSYKVSAVDTSGNEGSQSDSASGTPTAPNSPPNTPSNPSPVNGSTNNPLGFTWSIPINDPEGDRFSWTIQCNDGQTSKGTKETNETKSLSLSGLAYSTTYTIWVNATDPTPAGSGLWTRRWFTFTTQGSDGNNPPEYGGPSPVNGSVGNLLSLSWSIPISDLEGNACSWTIQCSNGQTNSATGAANGTKTLSLSGFSYSITYTIWVNATDPIGSGNYTRKWYTFTTKSSGGDGGGGGGGDDETPNIKPIADASAGEPYQGFVNENITFDGSKSSDSDGTITKWFWDFGDTTNGTGQTVTHAFSQVGNYTVTLTVTDNEGATHTDTTTCTITQNTTQPNRPPTKPVITGVMTGLTNTQYTYTVVATDPDNDTIQYTFYWGDSTTNSSGFLPNGTSFSINHSWATPGPHTITVTGTDNQTESYSSMIVNINAEEKKPSTPGFELVFVIGAIAVALFLWRKKRNV
jgi:chitodextrinase